MMKKLLLGIILGLSAISSPSIFAAERSEFKLQYTEAVKMFKKELDALIQMQQKKEAEAAPAPALAEVVSAPKKRRVVVLPSIDKRCAIIKTQTEAMKNLLQQYYQEKQKIPANPIWINIAEYQQDMVQACNSYVAGFEEASNVTTYNLRQSSGQELQEALATFNNVKTEAIEAIQRDYSESMDMLVTEQYKSIQATQLNYTLEFVNSILAIVGVQCLDQYATDERYALSLETAIHRFISMIEYGEGDYIMTSLLSAIMAVNETWKVEIGQASQVYDSLTSFSSFSPSVLEDMKTRSENPIHLWKLEQLIPESFSNEFKEGMNKWLDQDLVVFNIKYKSYIEKMKIIEDFMISEIEQNSNLGLSTRFIHSKVKEMSEAEFKSDIQESRDQLLYKYNLLSQLGYSDYNEYIYNLNSLKAYDLKVHTRQSRQYYAEERPAGWYETGSYEDGIYTA